jgi:hypothetical protein
MAQDIVMPNTVNEFFDRWFLKPIEALKKVPNNDALLFALTTACALYERYAAANKETVSDQLAKDFNISSDAAKIFWEIIRVGLSHQAMPTQLNYGKTLSPCRFSTKYSFPIEIIGGQLKIHPWLVVDKIVSLWKQNIDRFDNKNFPVLTTVVEHNSLTATTTTR